MRLLLTFSVSVDACAARIGAGESVVSVSLPAASMERALTVNAPSASPDRSSTVCQKPLAPATIGDPCPARYVVEPPLDLSVRMTSEPGSALPLMPTAWTDSLVMREGIVIAGATGAVWSTVNTKSCADDGSLKVPVVATQRESLVSLLVMSLQKAA